MYFDYYTADIAWLAKSCRQRVNFYPPSLQQFALQTINDFFSGKISPAFFLYPLWLQQELGADPGISRLVARANIYMASYYLIQDQIMDYRNPVVHLAPLGSFFFNDFMTEYHNLFPPHSPFWTYHERYMNQWAQSTLQEQTEVTVEGVAKVLDNETLLKHKAAPMKTPCAALCLLAGKENLIKPLEKIIDYWQGMLQWMDDCGDWREDLAAGIHTGFLSLAMQYCGVSEMSQLSDKKIKGAIFIGGIGEAALARAINYGRLAADNLAGFNAPHFIAYIESMIKMLESKMEQMKNTRQCLLRGGFSVQLAIS